MIVKLSLRYSKLYTVSTVCKSKEKNDAFLKLALSKVHLGGLFNVYTRGRIIV